MEPGHIEVYSHGGRIGVMVQFICHDSFAIRTDQFKSFARGVAMQVAAANPSVLVPEDLDPAIRQREMAEAERVNSGKSDTERAEAMAFWEKKIDEQYCLFSQPYVKDADKTVGQVLAELVAELKVPVTISKWVRWETDQASC